MAITKLVRAELDRAVQEELFDIKVIGFGEGLVTVFSQNTETCKNAYKSNGNNRMFISSVLQTVYENLQNKFVMRKP